MSSFNEDGSVRNAPAVVETVRSASRWVGELARLTGIEKSAAHRLAVTLHRAGWLDRTSDGRWQIAGWLGRLARRAATAALAASMRPRMKRCAI